MKTKSILTIAVLAYGLSAVCVAYHSLNWLFIAFLVVASLALSMALAQANRERSNRQTLNQIDADVRADEREEKQQ